MRLETLTRDIGDNHESIVICLDDNPRSWDQEERPFEELVNEGDVDFLAFSAYDLDEQVIYPFFSNPPESNHRILSKAGKNPRSRQLKPIEDPDEPYLP